MLKIDGCAEVATDHLSPSQSTIARGERDLDVVLQHQLIVLSVLSPMVSGRRSQFVDEVVQVLSPSNRISDTLHRISDTFHRSARRPWAEDGYPESVDGEALAQLLG